ncbi:hypothetical protein [Alicyclobacillus kakegawensis]|uniref:hypothetical protein n=1 Tax=Alicyclobacillus kakegawensis TaxID=392012 RepID=UPI0008319D16|nr:hypothetical protein [Alicyclobacillus kakegawensis]
MFLTVTLVVMFLLAVVCWLVRKKTLRGLFATLAVLFFLAFMGLLGYDIGYQAGVRGVHILGFLV